jgi:hypothetical protein
MKLTGETRSTGGKSVLLPLCPPQIPHVLTRHRTGASAVTGRWLTAWAMTRPGLELSGDVSFTIVRLYLWGSGPGNHWIGRYVGQRAGRGVWREKSLAPAGKWSLDQLIALSYIDCRCRCSYFNTAATRGQFGGGLLWWRELLTRYYERCW